MKPFQFTLESVGTVRRRAEQKALEDYGRALDAHRAAVDALRKIEQQLAQCRDLKDKELRFGCTAGRAAQVQFYESALVDRVMAQRRAVDTAVKGCESALQTVLKARQQREIVDKFFERQKARHARAEAVEEQKEQDEMAGRRAAGRPAWHPAERN